MIFNEDSRVKIPALLTLSRLGFSYLSLKDFALKDFILQDFTLQSLAQKTIESPHKHDIFSPPPLARG